MDAWAGPLFAAAALLVAGGVVEVHRPGPTVAALRASGARVGGAVVRLGALAMIATGIVGLTIGGRAPAAAVAAWFLAFAAFVLAARLRATPLTSCGCFGRADTPPTMTHVLVNLGAVTVAVGAATTGTGGLVAVVARQPWLGLPFVAATALCAWLGYLALTLLPGVLVLGRDVRFRS